jgi:hypothetical protein
LIIIIIIIIIIIRGGGVEEGKRGGCGTKRKGFLTLLSFRQFSVSIAHRMQIKNKKECSQALVFFWEARLEERVTHSAHLVCLLSLFIHLGLPHLSPS